MRRFATLAWLAWAGLVAHEALATAQVASELPEPMGIVIGRLGQLAFVSIVAALAVAWAAAFRVRRGEPAGYWLCLCVSAPLEAAHVALVAVPGYVPLLLARVEPAVWLAAIGASFVSWPDD